MRAIQKIEALGVRLSVKNDKLLIEGKTSNLSTDQIEWLKLHKPQIIELIQVGPSTRLRTMAPRYRVDPDELLDWYRNDLGMIQAMDDNTLDAMVRDYAANRETFRGKQPYRSYCLWLYKLQPDDPDYLRQGLMADDPEEAMRRLESIYGKGNIHNLHIQPMRTK